MLEQKSSLQRDRIIPVIGVHRDSDLSILYIVPLGNRTPLLGQPKLGDVLATAAANSPFGVFDIPLDLCLASAGPFFKSG